MHGIVLFKDKWLMIFVLQISFCITRAKCKLEVMYSVNDLDSGSYVQGFLFLRLSFIK